MSEYRATYKCRLCGGTFTGAINGKRLRKLKRLLLPVDHQENTERNKR